MLRVFKGIASLLAALWFATLTSCRPADGTAVGGSGSDESDVAVPRIETPLRAPVWAPDEEAIFALDPESLKTLETVDTGGALEREGLGRSEFSGLAIGKKHIYLTLERKPYVLLVEKP